MFMLNKRVQKLIAKGTALIITLTVMIGAAWAILSTEKVGLSVSVSFDSAVTAKVYLATDSSSAGQFYQDSPTVNTGTETDFDTANSALIVDTYSGTASQKALFEALGTGNGLKCDANGEMEFYVYVENYSTTENVYFRANIDFVGTGEQTAPFSTVTNPNHETAQTAGGGSPSKSLLTFKIKSTNETGLNANAIQIEIELSSSLPLILGMGQYTSGNYQGLYYLYFGNYLSQPIKWLVIGNGSDLNGLGFPDKNFSDGTDLANNQLLLLSENVVGETIRYYSNDSKYAYWNESLVYAHLKNETFINSLFNETELSRLSKFPNDNNLTISILSYDLKYKYSDYCTESQRKSDATYWLARNQTGRSYGTINKSYGILTTGATSEIDQHTYRNIRPIIILNV